MLAFLTLPKSRFRSLLMYQSRPPLPETYCTIRYETPEKANTNIEAAAADAGWMVDVRGVLFGFEMGGSGMMLDFTRFQGRVGLVQRMGWRWGGWRSRSEGCTYDSFGGSCDHV